MPENPFDRLLADYAAEDAFARSPRGQEVQPAQRRQVGDEITLKAAEDEGWPEERGVIEGLTKMPWGTSIMVRVATDDPDDDGLREVTEDQLGP